MAQKHDDFEASVGRRSRAGAARAKAGPQKERPGNLSPEATERLVHEFRVHQFELEAQNENCAACRESCAPRANAIWNCTILLR